MINCQLAWKLNELEYLRVHVNLNFEIGFLFIIIIHAHRCKIARPISCSIRYFECLPLLAHYCKCFYHKIIVNWQAKLNCLWCVYVYWILDFYLLQRFRNFRYSRYLILKLSYSRITKYNKTANCSQNHWTIEKFNIISCVPSNFKSVSLNIKIVELRTLFCFYNLLRYNNLKIGKLFVIKCILHWYF